MYGSGFSTLLAVRMTFVFAFEIILRIKCKSYKLKQTSEMPWCLPPKVWGIFFQKKLLLGVTNFFGKIYRKVILYWEINDQIMPKGGGGRVSHMHFPVI